MLFTLHEYVLFLIERNMTLTPWQLQYDTILDLWGTGPNRPPIDTHHPAVRTHPVTGLKAVNVNPGFVTGFAELKKVESGKKTKPTQAFRHSFGTRQTSRLLCLPSSLCR